MRRAARIDDNQREVVEAFRALGCSVLHTHQLGHGAPDIIIALHNETVSIEIKDGTKPLSQRGLTPDEIEFHKTWKGRIEIVENVHDVELIVKSIIDNFNRNT